MIDPSINDLSVLSTEYCNTHAIGDDLMFMCCARGFPDLGEYIVQTAYQDPSIKLTNFTTQYRLLTLPKYHQAILDGIGVDEAKDIYPVELQKKDGRSAMSFDRWEFYNADIEVHVLLAGQDYNMMCTRRFTIIVKEDYLGQGKPCYTMRTTVEELDEIPIEEFPERVSAISVFKVISADVPGDDPRTRMAQSFFETDPDKICDPYLKSILEFMRTEEGVKLMNSIMQELQNRGIKIGEKIGFDKGEKIGFDKGEKSGFDKGQKSGFDKGQKSGVVKTESAYLNAIKSIGLTDQQIKDIEDKAKAALQA